MTNHIEKIIELNASIDRVWRALTDFREFGTWFKVNIDVPFVLSEVSTGHMTYPGYEHIKWEARIQQMEAMKLFSFTWHPYAVNPKIDYSQESPTLVEFHLEPLLIGTRIVIIESGFDALPVDRKLEAFKMNQQGWSEQIKNIQTYLN
ncbi:MAG: SRPBCC family protein [Myxococcaceae bacterium]